MSVKLFFHVTDPHTKSCRTPVSSLPGARAYGSLYVPEGCKAAYVAADEWKDFENIVELSASSPVIEFADPAAKAVCVKYYDINGDGELSEDEAAGVAYFQYRIFRNNDDIISFDELRYFTGLKEIDDDAFFNCDNLSSITLPNGVKTIFCRAFDYTNLTSIDIPSSVTRLANWFSDSIESITVHWTTPISLNIKLTNNANATLYVPAGSKDAYQAADVWKEFKAIYDNPVFYMVKGIGVGYGTLFFYAQNIIGNAGDEVTMPYYRYIDENKRLFRRDATNKEYNHRFTLSADNPIIMNSALNPIINGYPYQTENLEYTFTGIEDVVYLNEAEYIEGMTKCESDHALVRSSNAAAAYPADGDVEFVTLPAGIYQLTAVMYNMHPTDSPYFDSDNPWTFLADGEPIATLTNDIANFDEKTTEPFVLTKETTLAIKQKGDSQIGLDLIYIRRLQDNELYVAEQPSVVAGWKTELNIGLRNVNAVNMTDFYLQLPAGMTSASRAGCPPMPTATGASASATSRLSLPTCRAKSPRASSWPMPTSTATAR